MIAITGATGELGGRVARRLAKRGAVQRLIVRDAAGAPRLDGASVAIASGYHDRPAMAEAINGADTLFLVSGRESPTRIQEHRSAVDAAVDAGVQRIVYTSFIGAAQDATFTLARDHAATEQHIRGTGIAHTFLRNSMYLDFVPSFASPEGVIAGPAGEGRAAWVSRDDVADVATAVLTQKGHEGQTYDVTGPESHSLAYASEVLTEITGRAVVYEDQTLEEAYASRAGYGVRDDEVAGWVTSYLAVAKGEMDVVTDVVPQLTGRRAQSLREFLAAHPESYAHLQNGT